MKLRYILLITFVISINIFYLLMNRNGHIEENKNLLKQLNDVEVKHKKLKSKYFLELDHSTYTLDSAITLISPKGDTAYWKDVITHKPKLIFLFSELTCSSCIKSELIRLNKFQDNFSQDNIIFLTNYENTRDLYMFLKLNKIPYPIYRFPETKLINSALLSRNWPYYFVIKDEISIVDIFAIIPDSPHLTNKYLDVVYRKYFCDAF